MLVGSFLNMALLGLGFRHYEGGRSLPENDSRAISAAYHVPLGDNPAAYSGLISGAVSHEAADGSPGHCCCTSKHVESPLPGQRYAGLRDTTAV